MGVVVPLGSSRVVSLDAFREARRSGVELTELRAAVARARRDGDEDRAVFFEQVVDLRVRRAQREASLFRPAVTHGRARRGLSLCLVGAHLRRSGGGVSAFTDACALVDLDDRELNAAAVSNAERLERVGVDDWEWVHETIPYVRTVCRIYGLPVLPALMPLGQALITGFLLGTEYGRLTADTEVPS